MTVTITKTLKKDGSGDYTTFASWAASQGRDLVAADEIARLEVYKDGWTSATPMLVPQTEIGNLFVTDATRRVEIVVPESERHGFVFDAANGFALKFTSSYGFVFRADHVFISGLEVVDATDRHFYEGNKTAENLLVSGTLSTGVYSNSIFRGLQSTSGLGGQLSGTLTNCTIIAEGVEGGFLGSIIVRNSSCTNVLLYKDANVTPYTAFYGCSGDYNASSLATEATPGANSLTTVTTADFVDYAGGDYRTSSGSALATAGEGGGFIGAALEAGGAATSLTTTTITTEADLATGGGTITQTLTGDTYIAAGAAFDAQRQAFIDGLVSAQSETNGWNAKRSLIAVTDVARTSDTVVTITLPALTGYDITTTETITHTIPAAILTGGVAIVASPAIEITAAAALTLLPTPIESTEAFGTATVKVGGLIEPTPIETTLVFPTMTVSPEELLSIQPTPIESTVTFGGYTLALHPAIGPTPIESTVVFPALTLKTGQLIEWLAIASTADVASPTVEFGQRLIALNPIYSTSNVPSPTILGGELMLTSSIFKGSLFAGSLRAGMAASGTYPM